ncbi:MAG: TerB family tellurite resistance protein [Gammaproteobacteria bacterium]|jgi:uncharacterized tellurite resistance protein B-like protein|nr:TerB family tellurite resistance protein [Gammaproteobacteria bacterium]
MIGALKALFESNSEQPIEDRDRLMRLATAALLVETARADFTEAAEEVAALKAVLRDSLALSAQDIDELVQHATERVDESTSLYEFTRVINDHYTPAEKLKVIDAMWAVAYADGNIDKYEEHLIRKIAELTYVPHGDYVRSKLEAGKA